MAKDLNNVVEFNRDSSKDKIEDLLNEGKTILFYANKGPILEASLKKGYADYFQANIELISEGNYQGVCGCGKPNNVKLYLWKD